MELRDATKKMIERKQQMEGAILDAVRAFESDTGARVTSVYIRRSCCVNTYNEPQEIATEVSIGNGG